MSHIILRTLKMFALFTGIIACPLAWGKLFHNAYVSFELPPNWNCKLEGAEWVCENDFSKKQKEAIIILTAKEVGPADTLANYTNYLQSAKTLPGKNGAPSKSKVINVQQRNIGNQLWINGMHEGKMRSRPTSTSGYMATIKDHIKRFSSCSARTWNDFLQVLK